MLASWHSIVSTLDAYGINVPWLVGLAVAGALSFFPTNRMIWFAYTRRLERAVRQSREMTIGEVEDQRQQLVEQFDLLFAALMGKLERIIYIYSVMTGAYAVLSGWLVMKAFTKWLERQGMDETLLMRYYHVYLFGNIMSLIAGLALGGVGLAVQKTLSTI